MYSKIIVFGCILISVNCLQPSQQHKLPNSPQYVPSRAYPPSLVCQPCQRLAVGSNAPLNTYPRCQTLGQLLPYTSSACLNQPVRPCSSSDLQTPACQNNIRPIFISNSERVFGPSCGTIPVPKQQFVPSPNSLTTIPLLQSLCSSSISNFGSAPYLSPPCLTQAPTFSNVPMFPPPCFTSAPPLPSLPFISAGVAPISNLAPIPFTAPYLPQVAPPCLAPMAGPIMPRLGFPSSPCNRCAPVSPIPPSLANMPYSSQFTCQERLYLPGLSDIILEVENTVPPQYTPDCVEPETPLALPITFLPAASPVSALGVSVLPPVLPPSECKCLFLRKIPIPPPCI